MTKTVDRRYVRRGGGARHLHQICLDDGAPLNPRRVLRTKYQVQGIFDGGALVSIAEDIENVHPDKARMSLNACKTRNANDAFYGDYALAA